MRVVYIFLMLLLVSAARAQSNEISGLVIRFDIDDVTSVHQTMHYRFLTPLAGFVNYTLTEPVTNIRVSDGEKQFSHELVRTNGTYTLQIMVTEPASTLDISYDAKALVFTSDSVHHFFTEFSFDGRVEHLDVTIWLPVGYGVYQNSFKPPDAKIGSDGTRITFGWNATDVQGPVLFSVKFSRLTQENGLLIAAAVLLAGVLVIAYTKFKKKEQQAFLTGFREDEQKTIAYLKERKVALQRDLETEFKFSRAKATRVVMKLEERGLVRKQRYGRTNKLFWLK
ncbi:MAG: hypothetical protein HYY37_03780 [Candidatus Aenigmarchaeota archaeon]|nr:hypothetical protein [Candidatus Aenigmarchaeota archaeon]